MEQQTELLAQGRAGTYRKQPAGYRAFIPAPLPPDPPIQLEGGLQARLPTANLALGRLDGSIQTCTRYFYKPLPLRTLEEPTSWRWSGKRTGC